MTLEFLQSFQSKQTLQNYLDTKLYGDEKTDNFLGLGPSNSRYQSASNQVEVKKFLTKKS